MVVHAASRATAPGGAPAALVGGILLNQNLEFIDTINDLVYRVGQPAGGQQGNGDAVPRRRADQHQCAAVRGPARARARACRRPCAPPSWTRGAPGSTARSWSTTGTFRPTSRWSTAMASASACSMSASCRSRSAHAKYETLLIIALAFIAITAATVPIFLRWAQSIFMPLERVTATIGEVESGNLSARTELPASGDEIGRVAFHLDTLLDQLQERDRQLREWNEELNTRVARANQGSRARQPDSWRRPPSSSSCPRSLRRSAKSPPASPTRSTIRSR